jgi:hypothetical protein
MFSLVFRIVENPGNATRILLGTHLLRNWEVHFFGYGRQPSEDNGYFSSASFTFLLENVETCCVPTGELVIVVNQIMRCLRPLSLDVNRLELFTYSASVYDLRRGTNGRTYSNRRTPDLV